MFLDNVYACQTHVEINQKVYKKDRNYLFSYKKMLSFERIHTQQNKGVTPWQ
jgi:hypothetical protein